MGLFSLFKKKQVPDTLPDLASDSVQTAVSPPSLASSPPSSAIPSPPADGLRMPSLPAVSEPSVSSSQVSPPILADSSRPTLAIETNVTPIQAVSSPISSSVSEEPVSADTGTQAVFDSSPSTESRSSEGSLSKPLLGEGEASYFRDLVKDITKEMKSLDKLDEWYRNKFVSEDVVLQLREYWKNQKPELFMNVAGSDLKGQIVTKADELHTLEKEWQELYFSLLSKEAAIRKEEKALKKMLGDFVALGKKYTKESNAESKVEGKPELRTGKKSKI